MKKYFSALLTLSALLPMVWFAAAPMGEQYCPTTAEGDLKAYSVTRLDRLDQEVELSFDGVAQSKFCGLVRDFPR